jgi:hypothetical protein
MYDPAKLPKIYFRQLRQLSIAPPRRSSENDHRYPVEITDVTRRTKLIPGPVSDLLKGVCLYHFLG